MARSTVKAFGLGAVLALTAGLTACSDDGGGSDDDVIKVMTIASFSNAQLAQPQLVSASKAYAANLNKAGGIGGRKIEVIGCDSDRDPNRELACVQQAMDEDVVALVGANFESPGSLELLQEAGIPNIGSTGWLDAEMQNPISYPAAGGTGGGLYGIAAIGHMEGDTKFAGIACETPSCDFGTKSFADAWERTGNAAPKFSKVPLGTPDYTPQAKVLADGNPDAITSFTAPADFAKLVRALRQVGYDKSIIGLDTHLTPANIEALGDLAEGLQAAGLVAPLSDTSNPEITNFKESMTAQDPKARQDGTSLGAWSAWNLFEEALNRIEGEPSAEAVITALDSIKEPIDLPLTGPWKAPVKGEAPLKTAPRLAIVNALPVIVKDKQLVVNGEWIHPVEELSK